jgi:predicted HicB family RNase H-like nuclease
MIRRTSDNYLKVVEWSEEDQCYVGTAPGLIIGGVHGKSQEKVFKELCTVVEEAVSTLHKEGKALPPETASRDFSGKIALRVPPSLHKKIAIKAQQRGESINRFIQEQLEARIKLN